LVEKKPSARTQKLCVFWVNMIVFPELCWWTEENYWAIYCH